MIFQERDREIHLLTSWLDQQVNRFRRNLSILKMLMKEKKITESLITKEELLSFWTKQHHTLPLFSNMVLSTHSEKLMEPKETSQASQTGHMMLHNSVHSELVTYPSMVTIELLEITVLISKIQLKIL